MYIAQPDAVGCFTVSGVTAPATGGLKMKQKFKVGQRVRTIYDPQRMVVELYGQVRGVMKVECTFTDAQGSKYRLSFSEDELQAIKSVK